MKKLINYIFLTVFFIANIYPQDIDDLAYNDTIFKTKYTTLSTTSDGYSVSLPQVMAMSPNAAAMAQYADYPVSHYTGVPNISIPLYEINVDGLKIPVSLSYHASGIKVNQEASWVGLGWSLSGGGSISRTVKCADDFIEYSSSYEFIRNGFYTDTKDITNPLDQYYYTYTFDINNVIRPYLKVDSEPDIFFYTLPNGVSGKFILDKSRGAILFDKTLNLKIEVKKETAGSFNRQHYFVIHTPDGTQYYFTEREIAESYSAFGPLNENNPNGKLDDKPTSYTKLVEGMDQTEQLVTPVEYVSTWHISKIITPLKKEITFTYEKETYQAPAQESCTKYEYLSHIGDRSCGPNVNHPSYSRSKSQFDNLRLSSISWESGKIEYTPSERDREDMRGKESTRIPPKNLEFITIYNMNNTPLKQFKFQYSYFNNNYTGSHPHVLKRLKLNTLQEFYYPTGGGRFQPLNDGYQLSYFEGSMPPKNSHNTDYWGYNNGSNYGRNYYSAEYYRGEYYRGAVKLSNLDKLKIGTLSGIIYPTKGPVKFVYEENTFYKSNWGDSFPDIDENDKKIYHIYKQCETEDEWTSAPPSATYRFEVKEEGDLWVKFNIENMLEKKHWGNDPTFNPMYVIGQIRRVSTNGVFWQYYYPDVNGRYDYSEYVGKGEFYHKKLTPGIYEFEMLTPPCDTYIGWELQLYDKNSENRIIKGGGLRIKEINTNERSRRFGYPAGILSVQPMLSYIATYGCVRTGTITDWMTYLKRVSEPVHSLFTLRNGNAIGYSHVDEFEGSGKSSYKYHNLREEVNEEFHNYPYLPLKIDFYNGLPQSTTFYISENGKYLPLKQITYDYMSEPIHQINAFMFDEPGMGIFPYHYEIEPVKKINEKTVTHIINNETISEQISLEEETRYFYNNYDQISSTRSYIEDDKYEQKIYYPTDFTDAISKEMVSKHIVNTPIEKLSLKNGKIIAGQKTDYVKDNDMYLPKTIYTINTEKTLTEQEYKSYYEPELYFDLYTSSGKPQQIHNKSITITYLWSYKSQYPIVEIQNATFEEVKNALSHKGINYIQELEQNEKPSFIDVYFMVSELKQKLPNAHITIQIHEPGVGVTTSVDARGEIIHYEYDGAGRLIKTVNNSQEVLQTFDYNYKTDND